MSEGKKNKSEKKKDTSSEKEKSDLDRELNQTFPASDPPSRSRPGHKRSEDDDS